MLCLRIIAILSSQIDRLEIRAIIQNNEEKKPFFLSYRSISSASDAYCLSKVRLYKAHGASNVASNVGAE
jgi:hypothetical protein